MMFYSFDDAAPRVDIRGQGRCDAGPALINDNVMTNGSSSVIVSTNV